MIIAARKMPFGNNLFPNIQHLAKLNRIRSLSIDIEQLFEEKGFHVHLLPEGPPSTVELSKEDGLKFYRQMDSIRKMENICADLYRSKTVRGFCHLYVGQEACAVGIHSIMRPQDSVITSYRCHAWVMLKSNDHSSIFAELIGNKTGLSRGKGGSMHMYTKNFYGGNGIVGAHVPIGVGVALAHKYKQDNGVCVVCYGDGAANQGQVAEVFNISKLLNLPVIFVCENNHYAMGTPVERGTANSEYYRTSSFLPGIRASGMDILSVIAATKFAYKHIEDGKGPIILELMTYRYFGHSMSDPGTSYRDRAEIKEVREKRDPILQLKKLIIQGELGNEEDLKKIEAENKAFLKSELKKAMAETPVGVEELHGDVYRDYKGQLRSPKFLTYVGHKNFSKFGSK